MQNRPDSDRKEAEATQTELDGLVVSIELTLISIIQGVALYFLIENSKQVLVQRQWVYFPYAVTGLLMILLFWSRSLIHTFTVIRWPLEFGHNFLYVVCTFLEAVSFTQIGNPLNWFAMNGVYAVAVWALFVWDLKMIHRRRKDSSGEAGNRLYEIVERDQLANIRFLMPATFAFSVGSFLSLQKWPEFFLEKNGHFLLALFQLGAALIYLIYGIKFFNKLSPLIGKTRKEWRDDVLS